MTKEKKEVDQDVRRANLTFIQLIFPSFLLVLLLPTEFNGSMWFGLLLKILIFGYQYFITQHFVNSIYK